MTANISNRRILTQNLYKGEKILKEFKGEFPYLKSNTKYNVIIDRHKDDSKYESLLPLLRGQSQLSGLVMFQIRNAYNATPKKLDYLKQAVKYTKVANCQECAFLVHDKLEKAGIPSQNVRLNFEQKNGFDTAKNHAFTVIGMKEDADIANPHTWGKDAVIIDGWSNMVKRVQDGLEYIKQLFRFNPETENCVFSQHRDL
jgi:hypothetical protein